MLCNKSYQFPPKCVDMKPFETGWYTLIQGARNSFLKHFGRKRCKTQVPRHTSPTCHVCGWVTTCTGRHLHDGMVKHLRTHDRIRDTLSFYCISTTIFSSRTNVKTCM